MAINGNRILRTLLLVIIIVFLFACSDAGSSEKKEPVTISDSRNLQIYHFDPEVGLNKLEQKDINIFTPLNTTDPEEYLSSEPLLVKSKTHLWKYDEYLRFIEAVQKQIWGEDAMFKWSLLRMGFTADCQEPLDGFSAADLDFFRPITIEGESRYDVRQIQIRLLYGDVVSGSGTTYPHSLLGGWKNIDLSKLKITPDKALQIAEKNGGKDFRITVDNKCWFITSYTAWNSNWIVTYRPHKGSRELRMNIDPYTGKFEVLND